MPIPQQPVNLIPRPFASGGNHANIPDTTEIDGRASFTSGFPVETQLPLSAGGIAPNRTDFNGILHLLTAFGFWQQSGGIFSYSRPLNYIPPAVVYYQGNLWWCVAPSGPETAISGYVEPGTNENYWIEFSKFLAESGGGGGMGGTNPVGAILLYYGTAAPEGYLACNGSAFSASAYPQLYALLGKATTPDMRGLFVRGYDTRNAVDPDGPGRGIGSVQQDAMQPITGTFYGARLMRAADAHGTGALYPYPLPTPDQGADLKSTYSYGIGLDSSRVARTATETRPKNIYLLYCIKHD
jgi:hypothetical protein